MKFTEISVLVSLNAQDYHTRAIVLGSRLLLI